MTDKEKSIRLDKIKKRFIELECMDSNLITKELEEEYIDIQEKAIALGCDLFESAPVQPREEETDFMKAMREAEHGDIGCDIKEKLNRRYAY